MKDDYRIEEADDERTDGLVPDCDSSNKNESPFRSVLEYLGEFRALIDACGQVSYYYNMEMFVKAGAKKAKVVASAYHHDLDYYRDQLTEWKVKAERSFAVLSLHAAKFGYKMPSKKSFLNGLTLSKDRRNAYKDYLAVCVKNNKTLSPIELEVKFQRRLRRR